MKEILFLYRYLKNEMAGEPWSTFHDFSQVRCLLWGWKDTDKDYTLLASLKISMSQDNLVHLSTTNFLDIVILRPGEKQTMYKVYPLYMKRYWAYFFGLKGWRSSHFTFISTKSSVYNALLVMMFLIYLANFFLFVL